MGRRQYSVKVPIHLQPELDRLVEEPNKEFDTYSDAINHFIEQELARRKDTRSTSQQMIEAMQTKEFQNALKDLIRKQLAEMFQPEKV